MQLRRDDVGMLGIAPFRCMLVHQLKYTEIEWLEYLERPSCLLTEGMLPVGPHSVSALPVGSVSCGWD